MNEDTLKALDKNVKKKKRIATELASQVHDLVEDSLWTDYPRLSELAAEVTSACEAWELAKKELEEAQKTVNA